MPIFEFPRWGRPRSTTARYPRRNTEALSVVAGEVQRLELRELLAPVISISDLTIPAEGNPSQITQAMFVVTLSEASSENVTASFITQNGTAVSDPSNNNGLQADFNDASGTVTILAGEMTGNIVIQIVGDNHVEANETFSVVLSNPSGATFNGGGDSLTATGTITDDENPNDPALSVSSPTIVEGKNKTQSVQVTVSVSTPSANDITYSFLTADGTAIDASDYLAQNGVRTIAAGEASDTISIPVVGDKIPESNEIFLVIIQSVINANVSNPTGTVMVQDNDGASPTLNVGNGTATEGDAGISLLSFPITLSTASNFDIVINVSMTDGTAVAGKDYVGTAINHTIAAGLLTDSIDVPIIGDLSREPNESFSMRISTSRGSNVVLRTKRVLGTITDNDPVPTIIVQPSVIVSESDRAARFSVSLSNPTTEQVIIDFVYNSDTARQKRDFNATRARIIFQPGQVEGSLAIPIVNDIAVEPTETFAYTISDAVNALIDQLASGGIVTIIDNDHD
jgi:hypothetical protein